MGTLDIGLSSSNYSWIGPFYGLKYNKVIKETIKADSIVPIRNSIGPLGFLMKEIPLGYYFTKNHAFLFILLFNKP